MSTVAGWSIAALCVVIACGKGDSRESAAPAGSAVGSGAGSAGSASAPVASGTLTLQNVKLLQPESVVDARLAGADQLATLIKSVVARVNDADARTPGALPALVNAVIVTRASGTRVWLVGPEGDVAVDGLDAAIAKLPKLTVHDGSVGVIAVLARPGTTPAELPLPSAWTTAATAAGEGSVNVDRAIELVWPPDPAR